MEGRRGVVVVCAVLVVALVLVLLGSEREPRFKGKSLSAWVMEGPQRPGLPWVPFGETTEEALRVIGTNALPFLVKWMQYESPPWRVRLTSSASQFVGRLWFLLKDKR